MAHQPYVPSAVPPRQWYIISEGAEEDESAWSDTLEEPAVLLDSGYFWEAMKQSVADYNSVRAC